MVDFKTPSKSAILKVDHHAVGPTVFSIGLWWEDNICNINQPANGLQDDSQYGVFKISPYQHFWFTK